MSTSPVDTTTRSAATDDLAARGAALEASVTSVGDALAASLTSVLDSLPENPSGPVELAKALGVDKVLASRVLKALRNKDPIAVAYLAPGPDPLRRLLRAAEKHKANPAAVQAATTAIDGFEHLIRREAGDRAALDAMIAAWLPEARAEFELRRRQAAFRAMSELKGAMADRNLGTVMLHPSDDGVMLDVVWLFGLYGVRRLRPNSTVKFTSRRETAGGEAPRRPITLEGVPVDGFDGLRLDAFCSDPPAKLDVQRAGEVVHYLLAENGIGPKSATDLVFAEANYAEMARYVPAGSNRKGYVYAEVGTPVKALQFDVLLFEGVYPGREPSLYVYDTALEGVASVNDRARDVDRLDTADTIRPLGSGIQRFRTSELPSYMDLLRYVCDKLDWDPEQFRGYRVSIDYPIYGTQVAMAFDPPAKPQ